VLFHEPALALAVSALLAYLIGGLPFGYWFVRLSAGKDIRTMGSGNIGATNVHRTLGRKPGLIVLLLDVLKGFVAVWLAALISGSDASALAVAAFAVMLGHCYPVFLRFHGGKAVACFVGAFLYLAPLSLAIVAIVFIALVALTKFISLASIVSALLFPLPVWLVTRAAQPILFASVAAALLIVYRHRSNIARLRAGTEHVFSLRGGNTA
jgi:acyl phosphate:glycerol-3-phosphate acyltransferase